MRLEHAFSAENIVENALVSLPVQRVHPAASPVTSEKATEISDCGCEKLRGWCTVVRVHVSPS